MFRFFPRKPPRARVRIAVRADAVAIGVENASIEVEHPDGSEVYRDGACGDVTIRGENLAFEVNAFSAHPATPRRDEPVVDAKRRSYLVWFLKGGRRLSIRAVNATSPEAARAEAQRRIDEGGVIGIYEDCRGTLDDYLFGHPGVTVGDVAEVGGPSELADRDLETEQVRKGFGTPRPRPDHPF